MLGPHKRRIHLSFVRSYRSIPQGETGWGIFWGEESDFPPSSTSQPILLSFLFNVLHPVFSLILFFYSPPPLILFSHIEVFPREGLGGFGVKVISPSSYSSHFPSFLFLLSSISSFFSFSVFVFRYRGGSFYSSYKSIFLS
jgi:hypothetical protein